MKIFPAEKVREIDNYTIQHEPIDSIDLMERAASRLTGWYTRHFKIDRRTIIFAGPGNNGGDALAMGRMLAERQYSVLCYLINPKNKRSADNEVNLQRLKNLPSVHIETLKEGNPLPGFHQGDVVIDGIFGSGLTRGASGFFREVIQHLNRKAATIVSIDIPSGLFGEDNTKNDPEGIIRAHFTLTFQFPFLSFFFPENRLFTGRCRVLNIGLHKGYIRQSDCIYHILERQEIKKMIPARGIHAHKGKFGHALVIGGSEGMMGAAILAAKAALRSGAGLVSVHVPAHGRNIIHTAVPEAMVSTDPDEEHFSQVPDLQFYQAVAVGPGLSQNSDTGKAAAQLLQVVKVPLVLDADALNIISKDQSLLEKLPENAILTPHPGEFDRLAGPSENSWQRHLKQVQFSKDHEVIVVLKGAYTGVSFPDGRYFFNTTGNSGMATGGSGDVLTGIIVSLAARGLKPAEAALAGVYLHGIAGDLAVQNSDEDALIAGDIVEQLGKAFQKIRSTPFMDEQRRGNIGIMK